MFKTWFVYSVTLVATFTFFLCYKMWVSWYCLMLVLLVPVIALLSAILAAASLRYPLEAAGGANIGQPAFIKLTISGFASGFAFCDLKVETTDYMSGEKENLSITINIRGVTEIPVDTSHCGVYSYRVNKLLIYDLFGFFKFSKRLNKDIEFVVRPVPEMPDYVPDVYGFKAKHLRKSGKSNSEIYDIREYQLGDPIKTIHWKMSAKKGRTLVKEPLEEYGGHSRVVLRLTDDRATLDRHLGEVLFTSRFYLDHDTAHIIRVIPPDHREVAYNIESEIDLQKALYSILRMRIPEEAYQNAKKAVAEEANPVEDSHEE